MLCGENEPLLLPMNSIYIKYGDWTMKKNLIVLLVCMIFFTGCSSLCITSNAMSSDESIVQAYTVSLEKSNLRTYIDVYESQLLYMEIGRTAVEFFIYNFQTGENQSVGHVSDFALKGRSNVMIDDILYFYISTYSDNDMKNVLHAVDFSEMKMTPISENLYLQKLIPVVEMNNQIIALQGNALSDGSMDTFLETITKDGDFKQIRMDSSKVYSTSAECNIIYIDSDNEYLYVLERAKNNSDTQYFLNKYDLDFICVGTIDITSIFRDYEITDNIGGFYAFNNYFCITDYSGVSIICKYTDKEIEMLLCEANLEYIPNSNNKTGYELFYLRNTNNIYRLNKQTGALEIQNYFMENEQFVIRCVLSYDNMLMISKYSLSETDTKDKLYLVPFTDNSLSN